MVSMNRNLVLELAEQEEGELLLKIALENPEPKGVKLSRKNQVLVTIFPEDYQDDAHIQT